MMLPTIPRPSFAAIAAIGEDNQLGLDGSIPWRISADFKHFKTMTTGCPMIMGRKTFESLPGLLPGRPHLVVTRDQNYKHPLLTANPDSVFVDTAINNAIARAESMAAPQHDADQKREFVIGGEEIYRFFLYHDLLDEMVLTHVSYNGDADTYFPEFNENPWMSSEISSGEGGGFKYNIVHYTSVRRWAMSYPTEESKELEKLRAEVHHLKEFARTISNVYKEHRGCFCAVCDALYALRSPQMAGVRLHDCTQECSHS